MQAFKLKAFTQQADGQGGVTTEWADVDTVYGYLDLITGTNQNSAFLNAETEQSTHVLVIPKYQDGITDKMRIADVKGRLYSVTYVDNPVGVNHHLEIYLKFEGDTIG